MIRKVTLQSSNPWHQPPLETSITDTHLPCGTTETRELFYPTDLRMMIPMLTDKTTLQTHADQFLQGHMMRHQLCIRFIPSYLEPQANQASP